MNKWDFITLQQASGFSGIPQSYIPYITELVKYVSDRSNGFKFLFHQTWAYEKDSTHQHFTFYNNDQHEMFRRLKDCSEMASKLIDAEIIRVGEAIQNLRDKIKEFDYDNGGISLNRDGFHLSLDYGRFAAAAVWLKKITGLTPDIERFITLCPEKNFDRSLLELIVNNI